MVIDCHDGGTVTAVAEGIRQRFESGKWDEPYAQPQTLRLFVAAGADRPEVIGSAGAVLTAVLADRTPGFRGVLTKAAKAAWTSALHGDSFALWLNTQSGDAKARGWEMVHDVFEPEPKMAALGKLLVLGESVLDMNV